MRRPDNYYYYATLVTPAVLTAHVSLLSTLSFPDIRTPSWEHHPVNRSSSENLLLICKNLFGILLAANLINLVAATLLSFSDIKGGRQRFQARVRAMMG